MAGVRGIRRRQALWVLGAACVVLSAVLVALDRPLWDTGGPGGARFEFAAFEGRSDEILVEWGDRGRDAARMALWVDYLYLCAYGAFWALAAAAVRDRARERGWRRFERAGPVAIVAAVGGAACDAVENAALLVVLGGDGRGAAPVVAAIFATCKLILLGFAIGYVAVGVFRGLHARHPRGTRRAVVVVLVLGTAFHAVNTWTLERETRAAEPDGGRVVDLPSGDLHVREDGDASGPPLLLVHGFGASLHWWDAVVPALAREHRVIRVDLLGHGGSEKPRTGYSMQEQADRLAALLDRLDVPRATLVGHSMGGTVAVAFAERHPDRVVRMMTIGTPPEPVGRAGFPQLLAFWPVTGHAIRRFLRYDQKRAEVESAFIPEYDVPRRHVEDIFDRTTFTSFRESGQANERFQEARALDERLGDARVPATIVYGRRDESFRSAHADRWRRIARARVVVLDGLGHTPQLEGPRRMERVLLEFAR